MKYHYLY